MFAFFIICRELGKTLNKRLNIQLYSSKKKGKSNNLCLGKFYKLFFPSPGSGFLNPRWFPSALTKPSTRLKWWRDAPQPSAKLSRPPSTAPWTIWLMSKMNLLVTSVTLTKTGKCTHISKALVTVISDWHLLCDFCGFCYSISSTPVSFPQKSIL